MEKSATQEMVYWQDIQSDSNYQSPFYRNNEKKKRKTYLSFEPDGGGWNNIRMVRNTFFFLLKTITVCLSFSSLPNLLHSPWKRQ